MMGIKIVNKNAWIILMNNYCIINNAMMMIIISKKDVQNVLYNVIKIA